MVREERTATICGTRSKRSIVLVTGTLAGKRKEVGEEKNIYLKT